MPVTQENIDIAASPEDIFAVLINPGLYAQYQVGLEGLRDYHGGEVQVGDEWIAVNKFMGREIAAHITCLEVDAPHKFVIQNTSDSAEITIMWTLTPIDGGTHLEFYSEGEPQGFFASLALNLVKGNFDKNVRQTLQNLKAGLEG